MISFYKSCNTDTTQIIKQDLSVFCFDILQED